MWITRFHNLQRRLNDEANDDGGADGGSGGNNDGGDGGDNDAGDKITLSPSELQAKIQEAIESEVTGLRTKNSELLGKLKGAKEKLDEYSGLGDPNKVKDILGKIEKDEELRLLSEGKHDEVFKRRAERLTAEYQSKIDSLESRSSENETKLKNAEAKIHDLVINQTVSDHFLKAGGLEGATQDAIVRASSVFKLEDSVPVARDSNGELIRGDNGPITIKEWCLKLKTDAPHLFKQSRGAGMNSNDMPNGMDNDEAMLALKRGDMTAYRKLREENRKRIREGH